MAHRFSLKNNRMYYIYNRTADHRKIFSSSAHCIQFFELARYYRSAHSDKSFSQICINDKQKNVAYMNRIRMKRNFRVSILAYCFLPSEFHFIMYQHQDEGIATFMRLVSNAFTHYVNNMYKRNGSIFEKRFYAYPVSTSEAAAVSKQIHLYPYVEGIVAKPEDLVHYPWISYRDYVRNTDEELVDTERILSHFDNCKSSYESYLLESFEN